MSGIYVNMQREHFFNEEQKVIKGQIMDKLISDLFNTMMANVELFDAQGIMDMYSSILLMFNREVLVHMIRHTILDKSSIQWEEAVRKVYLGVKEEVVKYCTAIKQEEQERLALQ